MIKLAGLLRRGFCMNNESNLSKAVFIFTSLYAVIYSVFTLINVLTTVYAISLEPIFNVVILIALLGAWGLCSEKKVFSKAFWKYFLIFQSVFSVCYFYIMYNLVVGIKSVFIYRIIAVIPLIFLVYLYTYKSDKTWGIIADTEYQEKSKINPILLFILALVLITLNYNPFFPGEKLTLSEYNSLGVQAANRGDFVSERRYYTKGLEAAKRLHQENSADVGKICFNFAISYDERLKYEESGEYSLRAAKIYKNLIEKDKKEKKEKNTQYYNMLAESYRFLGDNETIKPVEKRISYLNEAITIFKDLKDNSGLASAYQGLADIYSDKGDYKKSKQYFEKALNLAEENKMNDLMAVNYKLLADSLFKQKKYKDAEKMARKSVEIYKKAGRQDLIYLHQLGNAYAVLAKTLSAQGKCEEASKYYSIGVPMMNGTVKVNPIAIKLMLDSFNDECKIQIE